MPNEEDGIKLGSFKSLFGSINNLEKLDNKQVCLNF